MKIINRIKNSIEFQQIVKTTKFVKTSEFIIHYQKNNLGYPRIGLSTPKHLGCAVVRNKIRRQLRAMLQQFAQTKISIDLIIVVRKNYKIDEFESNLDRLSSTILKIRSLINEQKNY